MAKTPTRGADGAGQAPSKGATTIQISAEELSGLAEQIAKLDTKIASASGSDTAARKAFIEELITKNADRVDGTVTGLIEQLAEVDIAVLVGLVTRLEERMKAELTPKVDAYVDVEFPKTQTGTKEEVGALREARKELLTQFKALREVLNTFKIDTSGIPDPKRSGGGRPSGSGGGKGSKTGENKEGYRYLIDGKGRPPSQNSFSSLAFYATIGVPAAVKDGTDRERWGAPELKDFLVKAGIKFGEDDTWEAKLPNDRVVAARRMTEEDKIEFGICDTPATPGLEVPNSGDAVPDGAQA